MNIHVLTLGHLAENCYLVEISGCVVVIDPGFEPEAVLHAAGERKIEAILLTHGHFDHVGAVEALVEKCGCPVWMHQADYSPGLHPMREALYPLADWPREVMLCEEGDSISAAGLRFQVLETPGHTWGSVCYRCGSALFSGDTLFAGSCGRTDLPGGSPEAMRRSLARLRELPGDCTVYPGHGDATTLARERQENPYF